MTKTFTFKAADLYSKSGFVDGNMLDYFLWDNGFEHIKVRGESEHDDENMDFEEIVLCVCVERFLLPALPIPIAFAPRADLHNSARAENWYDDPPPEVADFVVEVSGDAILGVAQDVREKWELEPRP